MISLISTQINGWVNNGEAGDLRRHRAHYDVIVMSKWVTGVLQYRISPKSILNTHLTKSRFSLTSLSAVMEITKSSSTFSATNISSNIVWLLQLHDTIQMKLRYTRINYNHDNIAIRSHIMIYNNVWNLIFVTKFSTIYLAKGEKRLVFRLSFVNLQRAKDGKHIFYAKYRYVFVV